MKQEYAAGYSLLPRPVQYTGFAESPEKLKTKFQNLLFDIEQGGGEPGSETDFERFAPQASVTSNEASLLDTAQQQLRGQQVLQTKVQQTATHTVQPVGWIATGAQRPVQYIDMSRRESSLQLGSTAHRATSITPSVAVKITSAGPQPISTKVADLLEGLPQETVANILTAKHTTLVNAGQKGVTLFPYIFRFPVPHMDYRPSDGRPFVVTGPVIGFVTATTCRILIEVSKTHPVTLCLNDRSGNSLSNTMVCPKGRPVVYKFVGLEPGTYYQVLCSVIVPRLVNAGFHTMSGNWQLSTKPSNVLFVSSNDEHYARTQELVKESDLWTSVYHSNHIDLAVHLGNNVPLDPYTATSNQDARALLKGKRRKEWVSSASPAQRRALHHLLNANAEELQLVKLHTQRLLGKLKRALGADRQGNTYLVPVSYPNSSTGRTTPTTSAPSLTGATNTAVQEPRPQAQEYRQSQIVSQIPPKILTGTSDGWTLEHVTATEELAQEDTGTEQPYTGTVTSHTGTEVLGTGGVRPVATETCSNYGSDAESYTLETVTSGERSIGCEHCVDCGCSLCSLSSTALTVSSGSTACMPGERMQPHGVIVDSQTLTNSTAYTLQTCSEAIDDTHSKPSGTDWGTGNERYTDHNGMQRYIDSNGEERGAAAVPKSPAFGLQSQNSAPLSESSAALANMTTSVGSTAGTGAYIPKVVYSYMRYDGLTGTYVNSESRIDLPLTERSATDDAGRESMTFGSLEEERAKAAQDEQTTVAMDEIEKHRVITFDAGPTEYNYSCAASDEESRATAHEHASHISTPQLDTGPGSETVKSTVLTSAQPYTTGTTAHYTTYATSGLGDPTIPPAQRGGTIYDAYQQQNEGVVIGSGTPPSYATKITTSSVPVTTGTYAIAPHTPSTLFTATGTYHTAPYPTGTQTLIRQTLPDVASALPLRQSPIAPDNAHEYRPTINKLDTGMIPVMHYDGSSADGDQSVPFYSPVLGQLGPLPTYKCASLGGSQGRISTPVSNIKSQLQPPVSNFKSPRSTSSAKSIKAARGGVASPWSRTPTKGRISGTTTRRLSQLSTASGSSVASFASVASDGVNNFESSFLQPKPIIGPRIRVVKEFEPPKPRTKKSAYLRDNPPPSAMQIARDALRKLNPVLLRDSRVRHVIVEEFRDVYRRTWNAEFCKHALANRPNIMTMGECDILQGAGSSDRQFDSIEEILLSCAYQVYNEYQRQLYEDYNPEPVEDIDGIEEDTTHSAQTPLPTQAHHFHKIGETGFMFVDVRAWKLFHREMEPQILSREHFGTMQWEDFEQALSPGGFFSSVRMLYVLFAKPQFLLNGDGLDYFTKSTNLMSTFVKDKIALPCTEAKLDDLENFMALLSDWRLAKSKTRQFCVVAGDSPLGSYSTLVHPVSGTAKLVGPIPQLLVSPLSAPCLNPREAKKVDWASWAYRKSRPVSGGVNTGAQRRLGNVSKKSYTAKATKIFSDRSFVVCTASANSDPLEKTIPDWYKNHPVPTKLKISTTTKKWVMSRMEKFPAENAVTYSSTEHSKST